MSGAATISVPKGGGALSGMGETFQPDLHTGTGNLSVPITLPPGRRGLAPSLSLSYSTGAGNGPFGLGWSLAVPQVTRRTDKGIPRYDDGSDTFVLSGAEELVPVPAGTADALPGSGDLVARYRPRTETGFARITHVLGSGGNYWQVWSDDGLRSRYGTRIPVDAPADWTDPAIISNPNGGIFAWLLSETVDPLGNRIDYAYQQDARGGAQRYLSSVRYGDYGGTDDRSHLISVAIVYDEPPGPGQSARPDPFSDRKPGFELRTELRGREIQVHTHPDGTNQLASSIRLRYADDDGSAPINAVSLLTQLQVTGHDAVETQSLPPLELRYTDWNPAARRFLLLPASLPPGPLGSGGTELADLFGDGLPSLLQLDGAARYWRNRGDESFDLPRSLSETPGGVGLDSPGVSMLDLNGDGRLELVAASSTRTSSWSLAAPGDAEGGRAGFDVHSYRSAEAPTIPITDPQVRLIDLDGDHIPDLLYAGTEMMRAFGHGEGGFTDLAPLPAESVLPLLSFTDPTVHLADMTGDGLTDIVRIHNRSVTYWPNLGFGRFGPPIAMANAPDFADNTQTIGPGYDPHRLLVGDIAGDGTADIIYVGDGQTTVWTNQAGNGFAEPLTIRATPRVSNVTAVRLADMSGAGVSGILFSGVGPDNRFAFLDLTGGIKPYLLANIDNHAGASTALTYATSTGYATSDRAAGKPWITTLPFPVHVLAAVSTTDAFAGTQLTTGFSYHHGYWDPVDREFRGFAKVEQTDTLVELKPQTTAPATVSPLDPLARSQSLPSALDPAAAGNLLANFSFDEPAVGGASVLETTPDHPAGGGQSAAEGWGTWNNSAATTTTELVPSTLPYGKGGSMMHVDTDGAGCGLVQVFAAGGDASPVRVLSSVWLYVVRGRVVIGTGDGGNTGADAMCSETGQWMLVEAGNGRSPGNEFIIYAADDGGAEFYVDHAWIRVPAGPSGPVDSAPVRTVSWFHPGPITRPTGGWAELDLTGEYWRGDPPLADHIDLGPLAQNGYLRVLRTAVRAARGRLLRTECYADDESSRAGHPFEVHDHTYELAPVLDGRSTDDASWVAEPVVTVRPHLTRSSVWERGHDPMIRLQVTGDYDEYGRSHAAVDVGVARGRDPRNPGTPCLAVLTTTEYATRDDTDLYLTRRVSRSARHEPIDDGALPVTAFATKCVAGPPSGDLHGLELTYYDGPAFTGLGLGLLGSYGLPVRTEHLVITPSRLSAACQPGPRGAGIQVPPYLTLDGSPAPSSWPAEYPNEFRDEVVNALQARGPSLGYLWHPDGAGYVAGYYAQTSRLAYDVHIGPSTGRGLVVVSRDGFGGDTTTRYDSYAFLPVSITDPAGLVTTAIYDYRLFKPTLITDANGNRVAAGYSPLGLPVFIARLGKEGLDEGDTTAQPGIRYSYLLSGSDQPQPMSVTTVVRVQHRWTTVDRENLSRAKAGLPPLDDSEIDALFGPNEEANHPERFIRTVEFSDGFGRALQTRTQSDDLLVDNVGLSDDPDSTASDLHAQISVPNSPPVVVSGCVMYDNKGRSVLSYEPFAAVGYDYVAPSDQQLSSLARVVCHYDPRGLCVRTVATNGAEQLMIPGVPADLADPMNYDPTPWESYRYDANDNAGRTHPTESLEFLDHWNTPSHSLLDAFGRVSSVAERIGRDTPTATTTYDINGHPVAVTDPLGRVCAATVYDLLGQPWQSWLLDAGTTHTIRDAIGAPVEQRDDKRAVMLASFDVAHRPLHGWAADRGGQPTTRRLVTVYGDDPADAGLTLEQARNANALGRSIFTLDEAGQVVTHQYNLTGNPTAVTRRILRPDLLMSEFAASSQRGWVDSSLCSGLAALGRRDARYPRRRSTRQHWLRHKHRMGRPRS